VENYHRHIIREEAQGVLAWIVQGAKQYLVNGLKKPAGVRQATENYRVAEDEVALFIAQCCVTGDKLYTPAKDLYEAYCEFADSHMSQRNFGKEMTKRFGDTQGRRISGKKIRCYVGIGLLNGEDKGDGSADEGETGTEWNSSVPGAFEASQSLKTHTEEQTGTDGTEEQIKVLNNPSREGSWEKFTDHSVPSVPVVNGNGDKPHHKATYSTGTELFHSVPDTNSVPEGDVSAAPTRQEAAAARYREEDYRLALLARLVTADTGREERTRLYAMSTSELESLVHETFETS
jgi:phage/plasmid-associated DNA primase